MRMRSDFGDARCGRVAVALYFGGSNPSLVNQFIVVHERGVDVWRVGERTIEENKVRGDEK